MGSAARLRLFVALELPASVREELGSWVAGAAAGLDGLRWISVENLHVTLCFLGWLQEDAATPVLEACRSAVAGLPPGDLALGAPLWLPPRRPRVLAVDVEDRAGALGVVQARLSAALAAGGWYEPERRRFLPHVTVARVRTGARVRARELPGPRGLSFPGDRVTLFRSHLAGGGARYEALGSVPLEGGGAG